MFCSQLDNKSLGVIASCVLYCRSLYIGVIFISRKPSRWYILWFYKGFSHVSVCYTWKLFTHLWCSWLSKKNGKIKTLQILLDLQFLPVFTWSHINWLTASVSHQCSCGWNCHQFKPWPCCALKWLTFAMYVQFDQGLYCKLSYFSLFRYC